jgi:hypothetical protein
MENFEIKPIKNETEYKESFKKLNEVWGSKPNTKEGDILELLLLVIENTKPYPWLCLRRERPVQPTCVSNTNI